MIAGKRVVVTRAEHQAEALAGPLRTAGAEVILLPVIAIGPPADPQPLEQAAREINLYDWILFGSTNAVAALSAQLGTAPPAPRARLAAVGSSTKAAVERLGWSVAVVPEQFVAEELVEALREHIQPGMRLFIPAASITRGVLPRQLESLGAIVDVVEAYRNVTPPGIEEKARHIFCETTPPDWVLFLSSSAVDHLVHLVGVEALRGVSIGSIGPITSDTVRSHGLSVAVEPTVHTMEGLVNALCAAV